MRDELANRIGRRLVAHEIDDAAAELEAILRTSGERFGTLAELAFANEVSSIGDFLNAFVSECGNTINVKCVLLQHNGFVFNNDCWYFEPLAYNTIHDISEDYEWLCWPSITGEAVALTGLERTQADFKWFVENEMFDDERWSVLGDAAELLVKVRFAQLIDRVIKAGTLDFAVPVFTNAYDREFYCRFDRFRGG